MESFRPVTQEVLSAPPGHSGRGRGLRLRLEGVAYQQRRGWGAGPSEAGPRGTPAAAAEAGNRGWAPAAPARDSLPVPVLAERP